jgi:hypothetical protein
MKQSAPLPDEALAHALALIVAANGRIDARELGALDHLDAYRRVGVTRERFVDIAHACVADVGAHLCDRSWLCAGDLSYIDALLDAVTGTEDRMLVCRLAAAVVTADGRVTHDERLVFDHALARWRISQSDLTQAMLHDPVR